MRNLLIAACLILPSAAHAEVTCRETEPFGSIHQPQKTIAVQCYDDAKPVKPHPERCTVLYDERGNAIDYDAPCYLGR